MSLIRFSARTTSRSRWTRVAALLVCGIGIPASGLIARAEPVDAPEAVASDELDERSSQDNLLRRMTTLGIELTDDLSFPLPEPTFVSIDGVPLAEDDAKQALEKIAGRHGVKRFVRDSVVAPISVNTDSIKNDAGERIGHFIDVAFVVYQSIEQIRKSDALDDFKSDPDSTKPTVEIADADGADELDKNKTRQLTDEELAAAGVELDGKFETLGHLQLPLLGKVVVRGVARARRSIWSADDESAPIILTWLLDSRFAAENPEPDSISNQWRPIERNSVGEKQLGPPHPYAGMGGYVAITPVPGEEQASMVEMRFVIHEPHDWFAGRNLLRSKLPILIQDRVRNLRRELQD